MLINQLFTKSPPLSICLEVLQCFGLNDLEDNKEFTRNDLEKLKTVQKLNCLCSKLVLYYLPCKARTYLTHINTKNSITILRQIIKIHDYTICSKEKYIKGYKFIIYKLVPFKQKKSNNIVKISTNKKDEGKNIICFD